MREGLTRVVEALTLAADGLDQLFERKGWAAAGFDDTLLRWKMKPEVVHGEKK